MDMLELVKKNRSYRRFYGDRKMTGEQLEELVNLGRLVSCGGNKQYIKYAVSCSEEMNQKVYACMHWAGYLTDWDGPVESERPTGYILILRDKTIQNAQTVDEGIAAQTILLGAVSRGFGGCMLMNIDRAGLMEAFGLEEDRFMISMVLALGVPKETVVLTDMPENGDFKYYRDENQVHYVPKRSMEEVLVCVK